MTALWTCRPVRAVSCQAQVEVEPSSRQVSSGAPLPSVGWARLLSGEDTSWVNEHRTTARV